MKKHSLSAYFCGVFTSFLLFALIVPSFADSVSKQLTAVYNGVAIYINGTKLEPKDASGNAVQPFIVDGTTYLPLRAVADAVGYDVKYDASSNTVSLTTKLGTSTSPSPSASVAPSPSQSVAFDTTLQKNLYLRVHACIDFSNTEYQNSNTTAARKSEIAKDVNEMLLLGEAIKKTTTSDQLALYQTKVEYWETLYK